MRRSSPLFSMNERQEAAKAAETHRARVARQQQRRHAEGVRRLEELDQSSAAGAFIRAMHDPKRRGGHNPASEAVLDHDASRRCVARPESRCARPAQPALPHHHPPPSCSATLRDWPRT